MSEISVLDSENLARMSPKVDQKKIDEKISDYNELKILSIVNRLCRDNSHIKGFQRQMSLNVIGRGQNPVFHSKDKKFNEAAKELIRKKSKCWEGRDNKTRGEFERLCFETALREGEILVWYDVSGLIYKGRFFAWGRDQLVNITVKDFKLHHEEIKKRLVVRREEETTKEFNLRFKNTRLKQIKGIITNQHDITVGYSLSAKPGVSYIKYDKATLLPADHNIKLFKMVDSVNGKHGWSAYLSMLQDMDNVDRIKKAVIQKAEIQSLIAMLIKVKNPLEKQRARSDNRVAGENLQQEITRDDAVPTSQRTKNIETLAKNKGMVAEYLSTDEDIDFKALLGGESTEVNNLSEMISQAAGFSMGLTRLFTSGSSAGNSFAGLTAEFILAQTAFRFYQKWVERELYDFQILAVLKDAIKKGKLSGVDDYDRISHTGFPELESLNKLQTMKAITEGIRNGQIQLSPADMKKTVQAIADLKNEMIEQGVPINYLFGIKEGGPDEEYDLDKIEKKQKEDDEL